MVMRHYIVSLIAWVLILFLLVAESLYLSEQVEAVDSTPSATVEAIVETPQPIATVAPTPQPTPTPTPTPTPKPVIDNYDYVVRVVMQESGNQSLEGQMAVAQCIATTAEVEGKSLYEVVTTPGQYASPYPGQPNESVVEACERVFINGERVVDADIRWFYNPKKCTSKWHESKTYVTTIGDHRFFA